MGRGRSHRSSRGEDGDADDEVLWEEDADRGSFPAKGNWQHSLKRSGKRFHRKKTHKDEMEDE